MGGLAAAATLRQTGIDVTVYEQAAKFGRIGAGIQMMPNSMKVLRGIGRCSRSLCRRRPGCNCRQCRIRSGGRSGYRGRLRG